MTALVLDIHKHAPPRDMAFCCSSGRLSAATHFAVARGCFVVEGARGALPLPSIHQHTTYLLRAVGGHVRLRLGHEVHTKRGVVGLDLQHRFPHAKPLLHRVNDRLFKCAPAPVRILPLPHRALLRTRRLRAFHPLHAAEVLGGLLKVQHAGQEPLQRRTTPLHLGTKLVELRRAFLQQSRRGDAGAGTSGTGARLFRRAAGGKEAGDVLADKVVEAAGELFQQALVVLEQVEFALQSVAEELVVLVDVGPTQDPAALNNDGHGVRQKGAHGKAKRREHVHVAVYS